MRARSKTLEKEKKRRPLVFLPFVLPLFGITRALLSWVVFGLLALGVLFGLAQAIALSVGLQDMDPIGEEVQQLAGEAFGAKDLGPFLKGQVGGNHEAVVLVGPAHHIKEQFSPCLGKRDVSQLIEQ